VYFPDFVGNFYAVDAKTGALVWQQKLATWSGVAGDYARNDPAIYHGSIILGNQAGNFAQGAGVRLTRFSD
jgi:polyvinyl alcohol dehydrogenase (cytochrome)